jgi:hypothetical protein
MVMNYGYNSSCENYKPELECQLAKALFQFIHKHWGDVQEIDRPYIEVNGLYDGIRIRKITHLNKKEQRKLVRGADKIYEKVMLN